MLSASRRFSHILRRKSNLRTSVISPNISFTLSSVRTFRNLVGVGEIRRNQQANHITFIQVRFRWIWPFFSIISKFIGNHQPISTQVSLDEEELTDEMLNQILATIENDPRSSEETCTSYIDKLCRSGNLSAATRLLQSLRDKHVTLSPAAYNLLLNAAGERNDIDLLSYVFKDIFVSGGSLNSTSYFNLAKALTKTNDCVVLLRFVKNVSELTFPRSATVVNRMIYSFAECGQIDTALLIFDHIKSLKCKPGLITYNIVLDILGRAGRVDEMLHEFASMKEANIFPDIISYNTLLNNLRKVGRLDLCLVYLREMGDSRIEPDLLTYTSLIESFGRSGNVEEALKLFGEMKLKRIRPSIYIYRSLINNLRKMRKVELAMTMLEEMNSCLSDLAGPKDFKRKRR